MSDATDVLKERARDLARPLETEEREIASEHVIVRIASSRFALPLASVLEVFTPRQVTPIPGWPSGGAGLTSWRGSLLLVLDIRNYVGVTTAPNKSIDRTIVISDGRTTAGLIVDEVINVIRIDVTTLLPAPVQHERGSGAVESIQAVTESGVILLDPAALLRHHGGGG